VKAVIASTVVLLVVAGAVSSRASSSAKQSTMAGLRVRTLATIPSRVAGFAHNDRYLAWVRVPRGLFSCPALNIQDLRTGRRTAIRHGCTETATDPGSLVLAGNRAYWEMAGSSNLTEFADLVTASIADRSPTEVAFQSIYNAGFDHRVPPVSDGRSVYFWTSPEDATPGPLVRFDGRRQRRLTSTIPRLRALAAGGGRYAFARAIWTYDCAQDPAWSPDGSSIVFASGGVPRTNCRGGLWTMPVGGSGARRIAAEGRNPDWSPDGSKLAYDDGKGSIVVSDATGGDARTVGRGAEPAWSPDGSLLAFTREQAIFVAAANGSGERLITRGGVEPDWSPDGTRLVFARTVQGSSGLAIVGLDGSGLLPVTSSEDRQPAWSPDGRTIAYVHCSSSNGLDCAWQIFVVAPDGTGRRARTAADAEAVERAPSWAPDSRRLIFARSHDSVDEADSHIVTLSGRLTQTPRPQTPIVIRSRTGRTLGRIDPIGEVFSLAISRSVTAALIRGRTRRVEIYSPNRRSLNLGKSNAAVTVAAFGQRLVVRIGKVILLLDARSGRLALVARASSAPVGLSIVGRRIAWAENVGRNARIRGVTLPPLRATV
jgi:Tol biopolymer transport system component